MADVGRIQGPKGPQGTPEKEEGSSVDSDKFKDAMKLKAQKISELDPEEQKKRKQREEEEEETEEVAQGPTTPASQVTPFALESKEKAASPLAMQTPEGAISPLSSAQPTAPGQPLPSTTFFLAPSQEELADESGMWEETDNIESFPSPPVTGEEAPPEPQPEQQAPPQQLPAAPSQPAPMSGPAVSEGQEPAPATSQVQPAEEGQPQAQGKAAQKGVTAKGTKEEGEEIGLPVSAAKDEDREKILKQLSGIKGQGVPEKEEGEEEIEETGALLTPLTPGILPLDAQTEKKIEKEKGAPYLRGGQEQIRL